MTFRHLWVLLSNLPPESAYATALQNTITDEDRAAVPQSESDTFGPWSHVDYLTATLIDLVALWRWEQGDRSSPQPEPLHRPGVGVKRDSRKKAAAEAYLREVERLNGGTPAPEFMAFMLEGAEGG